MSNIIQRARADWNRLIQIAAGTELTFIAPSSERASVSGTGVDNRITFETDGQDAIGRLVHSAITEEAILTVTPDYPTRDDDNRLDFTDHLIFFAGANGVLNRYKVRNWYPDDATGVITFDLEDYEGATN